MRRDGDDEMRWTMKGFLPYQIGLVDRGIDIISI